MSSLRTSVGTNDIRSYFTSLIETLPFSEPPNHSHTLFPPPHNDDEFSNHTPPINLDDTVVAPPLHQQQLFTINNDTYSLPWGSDIMEETNWDDTLRWIYGNPNGLPAHETEFALFNQQLFKRHCSVSSIAETKLDTDQFWVNDIIRKAGIQRWNQIAMATSCHDGKATGHIKYGGTMTTVHGKLTVRVVEKGSDPHMGRWSYTTLQGKSNRKVTFITAYRVCQQHDPGPETAYFNQWHYLRSQGISNPDPRQQLLDDLSVFIQELIDANHEVALAIDGNGSLRRDSALAQFFSQTGLYCLHEHLYNDDYYTEHPLPATHKRGKEKIDFQAGTLGVLLWADRGGWEAFDEGLGGDHRSGFIDFKLSGLLSGKIRDIDRQPTRTLQSNNIRIVKEYRIELHRLLESHNVFQRIERLHEVATSRPFNKQMHLEVERLDTTVRESKIAAERHCRHRYLHEHWSPKLIQHALTQKFLKILLYNRKHQKESTAVLHNLIKWLPTVSNDDLKCSTAMIIENMRTAKAAYKEAKTNAATLRQQFLDELTSV